MFILFSILLAIIVYIKSFKDDFSKENIDKILLPLYIVAVALLILTILSSGLSLLGDM